MKYLHLVLGPKLNIINSHKNQVKGNHHCSSILSFVDSGFG